jgi:protein arginine N-methyltransferase 1
MAEAESKLRARPKLIMMNPAVTLRWFGNRLGYMWIGDGTNRLFYKEEDRSILAKMGEARFSYDAVMSILPRALEARAKRMMEAEVLIHPHPGIDIQYGSHQYYAMSSDINRMLPYLIALGHAVKPGMVVVELGAGLGIFALYAAKLGAEVIAVEPGSSLEICKTLARANGLSSRMTFVASTIDRWETIERKADLMISEFIGRNIFDENILANHRSARRNLAQDGRYMPWRLAARIRGCQSDEMQRKVQRESSEVQAVGRAIGLKLEPYAETLPRLLQSNLLEGSHYSRDHFHATDLLEVTESQEIAAIDLYKAEDPLTQGVVGLRVLRDGFLDTLIVNFEADLGNGVFLTNELYGPPITSVQDDGKFHPVVGPRRQLRAGDTVNVNWAYVGGTIRSPGRPQWILSVRR